MSFDGYNTEAEMNKQQELCLIEELAEKLGERSYAGPWLREQLPAIKLAMCDDMQAGCYATSFAEVRRIRAQAQQEADAMIDRAHDAAKAIKELWR